MGMSTQQHDAIAQEVTVQQVRLDPGDREELRKLTESIVVRHEVDPHVMSRMVELGYAREVVGGWEITEAGWLALERSRIPSALI
jgi:hypothetical protein